LAGGWSSPGRSATHAEGRESKKETDAVPHEGAEHSPAVAPTEGAPGSPGESCWDGSSGQRLLGLLVAEAGVLRVDVRVGAGGRLERHGADGALVEHLAVGGLDVGLDGVDPAEDHSAAGAPGEGAEREAGAGGRGAGSSAVPPTPLHAQCQQQRETGARGPTAAPCAPTGPGTSPCPSRHQDPNQFWALGELQFGAPSPACRWWIRGPGSSSDGAGRDGGGLTLPATTGVGTAAGRSESPWDSRAGSQSRAEVRCSPQPRTQHPWGAGAWIPAPSAAGQRAAAPGLPPALGIPPVPYL